MRRLLTLLALSAARRRSTNIACAPLDAASGEPARVCAPAVRPPAHRLNDSYRLRWLHAPKTGTSLANALFHVACPELPGAAAMPKTQRDAVERGVPRELSAGTRTKRTKFEGFRRETKSKVACGRSSSTSSGASRPPRATARASCARRAPSEGPTCRCATSTRARRPTSRSSASRRRGSGPRTRTACTTATTATRRRRSRSSPRAR